MAAASDIHKHFKGLRVDASRRRKSRADPFATGFEDDSNDEKRRQSRSKTDSSQPTPPAAGRPTPPAGDDAFRQSNDALLTASASSSSAREHRRPSPAPNRLPATRVTDGAGRRGSVDQSLQPGRAPRSAIAQAAGNLAYLDDSGSDDEELPRASRSKRAPSPAPRQASNESGELPRRAATPRGSRDPPKEQSQTRSQPSRHTVASPFAGTKYLEDSESDSNDEAVTSRNNSVDDAVIAGSPEKPRFEVKRTDKPRIQDGGGVSWRAFSAGRAEQRTNEIETLQANLRQRGKTISFCPHAITDDGVRIPLSIVAETTSASSSAAAAARRGARGKSPPRRREDTEASDDEVADGRLSEAYDHADSRAQPVPEGGGATRRGSSSTQLPPMTPAPETIASLRDNSIDFLMSPDSPSAAMTDSITSISSLTMVSPPQTIPEGQYVDHGQSPLSSPVNDDNDMLSRHGSTRSLFASMSRPMRIPSSRRSSRRSTSATTSLSPAHAFLTSWTTNDARGAVPLEAQADDEGQAIGINNEYIIGRRIDQGGFSVVKKVHSFDAVGNEVVRAVKIVRKHPPGRGELETERYQQALEHEISVWRHLKHRHILDLIAVYETDFATFCVMDLNIGGTLFDLVRRTRGTATDHGGRKGLEPSLACNYACQLATALRYLHEDIKVCHRDVKLENCLVDTSAVDPETGAGNLRLCDFGLADFLHSARTDGSGPDADDAAAREYDRGLVVPASEAQQHESVPLLTSTTPFTVAAPSGTAPAAAVTENATSAAVIGTLEYASPRGLAAHRKLFETAGDVWAFGVILHALVTGDLPFRHAMPAKTVERILRADWDDAPLLHVADAMSPSSADGGDLVELVRGCLQYDIDMRWTIGDVLRSPWFDGCPELRKEHRTMWR